ncbi:MAG: chemotaxis protein CheW [Spirochaetales bacterium]|nr:chemotaxis protein CheW [Spirochaetales bacterium]
MSDTVKQAEKKKTPIDFKMVTFSLGGKEYAIDIMKIKEISKEHNFTYVPNAPHYVLGVHNLRGEIIPIIDLRKMLRLAVEEETKNEEDILILSLEDITLGIVVDSIDSVVGISKEQVQEPHPLFGDINIRYISGIVETGGVLYVILDVERIFGKEEVLAETAKKEESQKKAVLTTESKEINKEELDLQFIKETLEAIKSFFVSELNIDWIKKRFKEWKSLRKSQNLKLQLENLNDAETFLKPFYSPYTGKLWGNDYKEQLSKIIGEKKKSIINILDMGCGKGYEAFSIACILRVIFPGKGIKVWAADNDLLNISTAPNLILSREEIPEYFFSDDCIEEGPNGYTFKRNVKDLINFEYHDILNPNEYPPADIIIARDILSFVSKDNQIRILAEFKENITEDGLLILGINEIPPAIDWYKLEEGNLTVYKKA